MDKLVRYAKFTILGAVASVLACCTHFQPTPTPLPEGETCASACANATRLNCDFAEPTANGVTCEQVCTEAQATGLTKLNLKCRTQATSCEAAEACEAR